MKKQTEKIILKKEQSERMGSQTIGTVNTGTLNNRKNKGITLIALVVTIIVLLILAGISIMMLTGENGILNRAAEAKEITGTSQLEE